jgi:hypothetical protein
MVHTFCVGLKMTLPTHPPPPSVRTFFQLSADTSAASATSAVEIDRRSMVDEDAWTAAPWGCAFAYIRRPFLVVAHRA